MANTIIRGLGIASREKYTEEVHKDLQKIQAITQNEKLMQSDTQKIIIAIQDMKEKILKMRDEASHIYAYAINASKDERTILSQTNSKREPLFNPHIESILKTIAQINELEKIVPQGQKEALTLKDKEHGYLINNERFLKLINDFTEYSLNEPIPERYNPSSAKYNPPIKQYISDNVVKYLKSEKIEVGKIELISAKITAVFHEILKECKLLYDHIHDIMENHSVIQFYKDLATSQGPYAIKVLDRVKHMEETLNELKKSIAAQLEIVSKEIVSLHNISQISDDQKRTVQQATQIITDEIYTLN